MFVSAPAARYWVMTKSSSESAKTTAALREDRRGQQGQQHAEEAIAGRCAEIGRRLLVLPPDRDQAAAHDDDDVGDREGHLPDRLRPGAEADERKDLQEEQEKSDPHDDLGGDEREQHERVRGTAAPPAPALQAERQHHPERHGHRDADDRQEEGVLERGLEGRIVDHAAGRIARVPAHREALPRRPRPPVVEREQDRDRDGDDRPDHVEPHDERQEARPPPRIPKPAHARPSPATAPARRSRAPPPPDAARGVQHSGPVPPYCALRPATATSVRGTRMAEGAGARSVTSSPRRRLASSCAGSTASGRAARARGARSTPRR